MKVEAVVFGAKWIVTTNCKLTLKKCISIWPIIIRLVYYGYIVATYASNE